MQAFDERVLEQLITQVLTAKRWKVAMTEPGKRAKSFQSDGQQSVRTLEKQLNEANKGLENLYRAIETGTIELDETLAQRVHTLKAIKQSTAIELANARSQAHTPASRGL